MVYLYYYYVLNCSNAQLLTIKKKNTYPTSFFIILVEF